MISELIDEDIKLVGLRFGEMRREAVRVLWTKHPRLSKHVRGFEICTRVSLRNNMQSEFGETIQAGSEMLFRKFVTFP